MFICEQMPRTSKSLHPVAVVRRASGKTAAAFAALCGLSSSLIRKIECRKRELTADAALKIAQATGADLDGLVNGRAVNQQGQPFTADDFRGFHERSEKGSQWSTGVLLTWTELLLEVAKKPEGALPKAKASLASWILKTINDLDLKEAIQQKLQEGPAISYTLQVWGQQLRKDVELFKRARLCGNKLPQFTDDIPSERMFVLTFPASEFPWLWARDLQLQLPPPPSKESLFRPGPYTQSPADFVINLRPKPRRRSGG